MKQEHSENWFTELNVASLENCICLKNKRPDENKIRNWCSQVDNQGTKGCKHLIPAELLEAKPGEWESV